MKTRIHIVVLFSAAFLLAALGCWFCWRAPMEWLWGENQHRLFFRQLCSNGIGMAFFIGAMRLGWRQWLKIAPYMMAVWGVFAILTSMCSVSWPWFRVGQFTVNVATLLWPVGALYIASSLGYSSRARRWSAYTLVGVLLVLLLLCVPKIANRVSMFWTFWCGGDADATQVVGQIQMRMAIERAAWLDAAGESLQSLPNPHTHGIVAGVALMLGKWAVVSAALLLGAMASILVRILSRTSDLSRRFYVIIFGCVLLFPAGWNYLQSLMLVPDFGCSFPLLSYGSTDVLCTWLGLGIVAAAGECGNGVIVRSREWLPWMICLAVSCLMLSALLWAPVPHVAKFSEPAKDLSVRQCAVTVFEAD